MLLVVLLVVILVVAGVVVLLNCSCTPGTGREMSGRSMIVEDNVERRVAKQQSCMG